MVADESFDLLPDLGGKSLLELIQNSTRPTTEMKPVIEHALRRVLASLDDPDGVISAFGSYVGT
jgi:hypothetical protein